ncbi:hypothetical protein AB4Z46_18045 [Variovorax sp. M-6]|uniref:hypothetical protein n=1 Tax=Variovorax sp. M-6 TaxID=3233041 RepID=UPI003F96E5F7
MRNSPDHEPDTPLPWPLPTEERRPRWWRRLAPEIELGFWYSFWFLLTLAGQGLSAYVVLGMQFSFDVAGMYLAQRWPKLWLLFYPAALLVATTDTARRRRARRRSPR